LPPPSLFCERQSAVTSGESGDLLIVVLLLLLLPIARVLTKPLSVGSATPHRTGLGFGPFGSSVGRGKALGSFLCARNQTVSLTLEKRWFHAEKPRLINPAFRWVWPCFSSAPGASTRGHGRPPRARGRGKRITGRASRGRAHVASASVPRATSPTPPRTARPAATANRVLCCHSDEKQKRKAAG
jgi:hypothetical protein